MSHFWGLDYSFFYVKKLYALSRWTKFPQILWNSTCHISSLDNTLIWLQFFPKKDHYNLMLFEFFRPFFYATTLYFTYLYYIDVSAFLNLSNTPDLLMGWSFKWGLFDLNSSLKWINQNSVPLAWFYRRNAVVQDPAYFLRYLILDFEPLKAFFARASWVFFPHVSTFLVKQIYLPIYLPLDSFAQGLIYYYNNSVWTLFSLVDFNINAKLFREYTKLALMLSAYFKHHTILIMSESFFVYWYDLFLSWMHTFKDFYTQFFVDAFDFNYFFRKLNWKIYRVKQTIKSGMYGFWSVKNIRETIVYFIAYFGLMKFLINIPSFYRFKDFWLYTIIWYDPIYLWNIYQVNPDLENDYMLAVDYLRKQRIHTYMYLLFRLIPIFYLGLVIYCLSYVLEWLEARTGFAHYVAYPCSDMFHLEPYMWALYVITPLVIYIIYLFMWSFLLACKSFVYTSIINNQVMLVILSSWYIRVVNFNIKHIFKIDLDSRYYLHYQNSLIVKKLDGLESKNLTALKLQGVAYRYWYYSQKTSFDWVTPQNYVYSKQTLVHIKGHPNMNQSLLTTYNFVKLHNVTWKVIRLNHFYQYYDYVDHSRLSVS